MFGNKKLKQELKEYHELYLFQKKQKEEAQSAFREKCQEVERLQNFDKKIMDKIEELCKPKINDFCLAMVGSGTVVSRGIFDSEINILNKSYKSLEELLVSQAKEIKILKERDEDNKRILFLSGKVEQLINKLNKK
jgi:predicted  nucleic acid-binding Zn-ribbon protein